MISQKYQEELRRQYNPEGSVLRKQQLAMLEILPVMKGEFEGNDFNIPNNSDAYLTKFYDDYMTLPNLSERNPHHNNTL